MTPGSLRSTNIKISTDNNTTALMEKLEPWLNPPDYHEVKDVAEKLGSLKKQQRRLQRDIKKATRHIKGRTDDAKLQREEIADNYEDELTEVEGEILLLEEIKAFQNYHLKMNTNANYTLRMKMKLDYGDD